MAAWKKGYRHESWLSDTTITAWLFLAVLVATVLTDWLNGPNESAPPYLTGLLGASGAILFGAAGSDKSKKDKEVSDTATRAEKTADRAEVKADKLAEVAEQQHPEVGEILHPPFEGDKS